MYDERTGAKLIRGGQPAPRGKSPTPCWQCPKGSPTEAPDHELSLRNRRAYSYYVQARAPLGDRLEADAITHRVFSIIDRLVRASEALQAAVNSPRLAVGSQPADAKRRR